MTKLTWDTDDWNNAVSSTDTIVDTELYVTIAEDEFESYTLHSFPPSPWVEVEGNGHVDDLRALSGSQSLRFSQNSLTGTVAYSNGFHTHQYNQITFAYNDTSGSNEFFMRAMNENDDEIMYMGSNNPQVDCSHNGSEVTIANPTDPEYDVWRRLTAVFDWEDQIYTGEWEDIGGNEDDVSNGFLEFTNQSTKISEIQIYENDGSSDMHMCIDDISAITAGSANLITGGKTS